MNIMKIEKAIDGYSYVLVTDKTRFGVICGCSEEDVKNPEMDIEPEWFEIKEDAEIFLNKELKSWNSCCL